MPIAKAKRKDPTTRAVAPSDESLKLACDALMADQCREGYWWYTLEANESIGAGFIQLMHFLGEVDLKIQEGLVQRILSEQRADGSWPLFFGGPPDISVTVECYLALRLAGVDPLSEPLKRGRRIIRALGGLNSVRVFTKIHLALFGLLPWSECPAMPLWFIFLPARLKVSIYEFSSWARASIVPLLIILNLKPVKRLSFKLSELQVRDFHGPTHKKNFFFFLDKILKGFDLLPWHPGRRRALDRCEKWIRDHIERTEDIYPAMAYAALAIKALGYPNDDPTIRKAVNGLKSFQQRGDPPSERIHQQCCISPLWDTPWACTALLAAGTPPTDPRLLKAARYLVSKEIKDFSGDWIHKNREGTAGGWAFEFQNDYFPDVDDTIQVLRVLKRVSLPEEEKSGPVNRGLAWLLSMQSRNGGWAAFDKNNLSSWVNKIPFADHGACLDPPTPDITGRALKLLSEFGHARGDPTIDRAVEFLFENQEGCGAWRGRWGVNFIYGTWCVLEGLEGVGLSGNAESVRKAVSWLKSVQNPDGGWGESCLSDAKNEFVPLGVSVPSQTAWGALALAAVGEKDSESYRRGIDFLENSMTADGRWEEKHFTGTGFPGHFYIRYHGYSQYFPVLALASQTEPTTATVQKQLF